MKLHRKKTIKITIGLTIAYLMIAIAFVSATSYPAVQVTAYGMEAYDEVYVALFDFALEIGDEPSTTDVLAAYLRAPENWLKLTYGSPQRNEIGISAIWFYIIPHESSAPIQSGYSSIPLSLPQTFKTSSYYGISLSIHWYIHTFSTGGWGCNLRPCLTP